MGTESHFELRVTNISMNGLKKPKTKIKIIVKSSLNERKMPELRVELPALKG